MHLHYNDYTVYYKAMLYSALADKSDSMANLSSDGGHLLDNNHFWYILLYRRLHICQFWSVYDHPHLHKFSSDSSITVYTKVQTYTFWHFNFVLTFERFLQLKFLASHFWVFVCLLVHIVKLYIGLYCRDRQRYSHWKGSLAILGCNIGRHCRRYISDQV